jgi:hypothetical protein
MHVLNQDENVVAYASRKLKMHEQDYPSHDLELALLIFAQRFEGIIFMENLMIYFTHHKSPKYLFAHELNLGKRPWLEPIKDYGLSIHYNLVKTNSIFLYAISCKPVPPTIDCLVIYFE